MGLHLNIIFHKFETDMKTQLIYRVFLLIFFTGIIACENPQDIPEPTHYNRVPQPQSFTAVVGDTTATGKYSVTLNWNVSSLDNIREFEIHKKAVSNYFVPRGLTATTTYLDTFNLNFTDYVVIQYFIMPYGKDKFLGLNSDTIKVTLIK